MPTWLAAAALTLWPRATFASTTNNALLNDVGLMEGCPPPNPDATCPPLLAQSDLWPVAHLEPCAASRGPNLFAEDPFSGAVLHACNGNTNDDPSAQGGRRAALPNACGDFRFKDVAVDERRGHLYVASTWAVHKAALPPNLLEQSATSASANASASASSTSSASAADTLAGGPLVAGFAVVHLQGFNLGASRAEVVGVWLRGVACRSLVYANATNLACVVGDLAVLSAPLAGACVEVQTVNGGRFAGVLPEEAARSRLAAGVQKPLVYGLTVDDRGFAPGAVCVFEGDPALDASPGGSHGRVFWSNRAAGTVESSRLDGSDLVRHAEGLPRVAGLATSADGATLFVSDAENGRVLALPIASGEAEPRALLPPSSWREVVPPGRGLVEPWGLALDEPNGYLFVADASAGVVWRAEHVTAPFGVAAADAAAATGAQSSAAAGANATTPLPPLLLAVVSANAYVRLSGVAVLPPRADRRGVPGRLDLSARLVWTAANAHAVQRSSLHGAHDALFASAASGAPGGGGAAAAPAARSAWNRANGPATNRYDRAAGSSSSSSGRHGAVLWPVAVRGVGGVGGVSPGVGGKGVSSVLPAGVVVAEYLGRVWLLRDDGGATEPQLLVDPTRGSTADAASSGGPARAVRAFLAAAGRDRSPGPGADQTRPSAFLQLTA